MGWLMVMATAMALAGCDLPYDPQGTMERVRGGVMRVGVIDGGPWASIEDGEAAGVEVEMVRRFAQTLGPEVEVQWIGGSESRLLESLERHELDLVIGGLRQNSPWSGRVALTRPYTTTQWMVGVVPGTPSASSMQMTAEDLAGREVAVARGSIAGALLKERGARVIEMDDPGEAQGLVAGPAWQLRGWGAEPAAEIVLLSEKHVLAVPPGENGWLVAVETFLSGMEQPVEPGMASQ